MITDPTVELQESASVIAAILGGDLKKHVDKAKELLKNRDIPLEVRWTVFTQLVRVGGLNDIESCGDGFVDYLVKADGSFEETTMYDDFHTDRHETTYYTEMYDMMGPSYHKEPKWTTESINEWREIVLRTGDAGFEFDW